MSVLLRLRLSTWKSLVQFARLFRLGKIRCINCIPAEHCYRTEYVVSKLSNRNRYSEVWWGVLLRGLVWGCSWCTLCLKKVPTFKLSVTLSNLNRFLKFLHCWKAYKICYKPHITLPTFTLGVLLHYLEKLNIQIFCSDLAIIPDMEENANKEHFKCTDFNSSTCVTVYAECIYVFLSRSCPHCWTMLIVDAVTSAVTNFRCHKLLITKVNK